MREYSVEQCHKDFRTVRRIKHAIALKQPSIAQIKKRFDESFIQGYLELWLVDLTSYLKLKEKMTPFQYQETVVFIIQDFYQLTLADVYLIMKNAKTGVYGKFYDRLNGSTILSWFRQYFDERCEAYTQINIEESNILRGQMNFNIYNHQKLNDDGKAEIIYSLRISSRI